MPSLMATLLRWRTHSARTKRRSHLSLSFAKKCSSNEATKSRFSLRTQICATRNPDRYHHHQSPLLVQADFPNHQAIPAMQRQLNKCYLHPFYHLTTDNVGLSGLRALPIAASTNILAIVLGISLVDKILPGLLGHKTSTNMCRRLRRRMSLGKCFSANLCVLICVNKCKQFCIKFVNKFKHKYMY